ncbi:hypothetical protein BJN42_23645 [Pseudomonas koreensis]|nr:hypothetical protein BJN42_23645 [Pseudomonas koreensis]
MEFLYRFRKVSDLKGSETRESELLGRYIFFASPEQLNDPLEGHRELIWRGDHIAWTNLFDHYFLCLAKRHVQHCTIENIEDHPLSVKETYLDEPKELLKKIKELSATFLSHDNIRHHLFILSYDQRKVKREELTIHLSAIHNYALHVISQYLAEIGLIQAGVGIHAATPEELLQPSTNLIGFYLKLTNDEVKSAGSMFDRSPLAYVQENNLKRNYQIWLESKNQRWMDLSINFPESYVELLKGLCCDNWYTACFMENCSNSAIWGSYGSGHTGACLKFKTEKTDEGFGLTIGIPEKSNLSSHRILRLYFDKVTYDGFSPDLDFFRNLGTLPAPKVISQWLTREGKKSICFEDMFRDEEQWRKDYHAHIKKSITSKTGDWIGEVEQRLVLQSFLYDYSAPNSRKLQYDFEALDSIIFGVNMPATDKYELIQLITEMCKTHKRKSFVFHQAYFTPEKKVAYRPVYTVTSDI